jgi:hypothetical protein
MDQLARPRSDHNASDDNPRSLAAEQLYEPIVNTLHLGPRVTGQWEHYAARVDVTTVDGLLGPTHCGDLRCGEHVS